ncbi:DUF6194 family protein [Serinibacter arcticus]|uniref:DUF6194 family protein n=1 Tax=Serinibacter arcticus TaxID=1655435 RepID=UPI002E2601C5
MAVPRGGRDAGRHESRDDPLDGAVVRRRARAGAGAGSEYPEIAWGDHFFYWAPDGVLPTNRQPYATVVTKNYPDDDASDLDPPGRWRLNVHVGRTRLVELLGEEERADGGAADGGEADGGEADGGAADGDRDDPAEADVLRRHPLYGPMGWIAVVNPGERTLPLLTELLRAAHEDDRRRVERRASRE